MLQGYIFNANFGDLLAACLFYDRCKKAGFKEIDFIPSEYFGIGPMCRKQLGYTARKNIFTSFSSDAFVLISGGSLWNHGKNPKNVIIRYIRFVLPALVYELLNKPVYVLGVGGGEVDTPWLRRKMVRLLNEAEVITFRDKRTKQVFEGYGVRNTMTVTADTMLTVRKEMLAELDEKKDLDQCANGRKKLLIHIPDGLEATKFVVETVLPAIIKFLNDHREYYVVLSNDNIYDRNDEELHNADLIRKLLSESGIDFYEYRYHDCWQMCSLINEMDCVVTEKLHVGVLACSFGKCVVSFPVHIDKTDNFYEMIGESDRCVNMRKLTAEKAIEQMNKFHDKPVIISEELRAKAEENLSVLDHIIEDKGQEK